MTERYHASGEHRTDTPGKLSSAVKIQVIAVTVGSGPGDDESQIVVQIQYTLLETQSTQLTEIVVS